MLNIITKEQLHRPINRLIKNIDYLGNLFKLIAF